MLITLQQEFKDGPSSPGIFSESGIYDLKCRSGFRWTDGLEVKSMKCVDANWTDIPESCLGI